jgi:outer membrane lipoprotein-sorting protein
VFDRTDTSDGLLILAKDGRYRVEVGADVYLYEGTRLFSYSADNKQVTVEKVPQNASFGGEISFITRLDEFYKTVTLRPDSAYRLLKKPERTENIPDSLVVFLSHGKTKLAEVQYYDENGDLNRIVFRNQETNVACDKKEFQPDFPDSAEVIELD